MHAPRAGLRAGVADVAEVQSRRAAVADAPVAHVVAGPRREDPASRLSSRGI